MAMTAYRDTLPPEFRLLLFSCRLETGEAIDDEIRSLLEGVLDWDRLIEWAVWHEVGPLLHRTLARVAPDLVPSAIAYALRVNYEGWVEHAQNLSRELHRVLEGLDKGGVPAIPFKGPAVAHSAYGDMALRPFRDLDFLLHPGDVDRALGLLETLEYVRPEILSPKRDLLFRRYACQYRIPRVDAKVWIEPHSALAQRTFAIDLDYAGLWERAALRDIGGYKATCLAPRDELLVLCTHGFREQWRRLKWVCDIAEIVRANPAMDWDALSREARAVGCARIVRLGLILARDLLDAPVPSHIIGKPDRSLNQLIDEVHVGLFEEKIIGSEVWTPTAFYLRGRERLRDKARYILRTLLAPRPAIIEEIRLPESLYWAYYPVRWVHDYVLLPPWSMWRRLRRA